MWRTYADIGDHASARLDAAAHARITRRSYHCDAGDAGSIGRGTSRTVGIWKTCGLGGGVVRPMVWVMTRT